jgi:hypothetical protein
MADPSTNQAPYRLPTSGGPQERPPAELAYLSGDPNRGASTTRGSIQAVVGGAIVFVIASALDHVTMGEGILAVAIAWSAWRWYRAPDIGGLVLRVTEGWLIVTSRRARKPLFSLQLSQLDDVMLDSKKITKVSGVRSPAAGLAFVDYKVGPQTEVARIALVPAGDAPAFFLTEDHAPYQDSVEWIARIRTFLRKHGWLPADERTG